MNGDVSINLLGGPGVVTEEPQGPLSRQLLTHVALTESFNRRLVTMDFF